MIGIRALETLACLFGFAATTFGQGVSTDFETRQLSDVFYAEGATFGDLNGDGQMDLVSGPFWYEGPDFELRHEFAPVAVSDPLGYSDDFFAFVLDVDGDERQDIIKIGFPGKAATWYRNPGETQKHWPAQVIFRGVDNESPTLADVDGGGRVDLLCNHGGAFGYASADADDPTQPWRFHAISPDLGKGRFTHGLGLADINGDGRKDVIESAGWWEQPASLQGDPLWQHHPVPFTKRGGGAQMYGYDIDGDGDMDVITSLFAHGWGLSWFEQRPLEEASPAGGRRIEFVEHVIMDREPDANPYGVRFSSLHALDLADVDGDGLTDLVTGKRHWSHGPDGDPKPSGPSVLYWFRLERRPDGVHFVPHLIDEDSGVGTQVVAGDVNGDQLVDVVVGNKQGTFLHLQSERGVSVDEPPLFEPKAPTKIVNRRPGIPAKNAQGRELNLGFESGDLRDWTVIGDAFEDQPVRGDSTARRGLDSSDHVGEFWIGGYEIHGDGRVGELISADFEVTHPWASFLVAGGRATSTRVELLTVDGELLFSTPGPNYEPLRVAVIDLSEDLGKLVRLRVIDEETGGWGHINFDDFLFHEEEPQVAPEKRMLVPDRIEHHGLLPEQAAQAMTVPEGFHVDLIAAEPELFQPIALAIDGKGRLWVAEAHSYPVRVEDEEARDQILVFEDRDQDGSFESRTVFADGLNLVSGLEVGLGGVWVGAAPYLMFIADRDDDLVPDGEPEIRLDGWEWQDTHETLNAFTWGPDGWLYGCHGVFTHSRVGVPGTPDEERVPINAGVWRYHPTKGVFEVFAWGTSNPWGIDFDERGQAFITACVIPHLFHVVQGGRYVRQAGSHFDAHAFSEIDTIADHLHWQGDSPWSGNQFSGSVGGGHAHCGAMIYLGDRFPAEYRGRLFMNNVHGNRINSDSLERHASGFVAHHEEDLLLANDSWFRGINMKYGPDGAVYFIDWSDERACHSNDPEAWTRSNGRLYRLRYGDRQAAPIDLAAASDQELIELQVFGDEFRARRGRLELQGREGVDTSALKLALMSHPELEIRLRALWALHAMGATDEALWLQLLQAEDETLVAWAIQLACESSEPSVALRQALRALARENDSPVVALYLASALQRIAPDFELAGALFARDDVQGDQNLPTVLWYGLEAHVSLDARAMLAMAAAMPEAQQSGWILRRVAAQEATRPALFEALENTREDAWRDALLRELVTALRDARHLEAPQGWEGIYARLSKSGDEGVRDQLLWIATAFDDPAVLPQLLEVLVDETQGMERRQRALESLATQRSPEIAAALRAVLIEEELRGAAIQALAHFDESLNASALLDLYPSASGEHRDEILATLSSRESFAMALLGAVEGQAIAREDLTQFVLRKLRALGSAQVDEVLQRVWGIFREAPEDTAQRIAEWVASYSSDDLASVRPSHGREVFEATCAKCHRLFGEGGDLGPDLTGSNRADPEYIWSNVLDPNAIIGRDYQVTLVRTFDGLLVTGQLVAESESSITLATETDEFVVAKDDIEERVLSELSLMPEGQGDLLSERQRRDLIAYLASEAQVPRLEEVTDMGALFNGIDLEGWSGAGDIWRVVDGMIVGRSSEGVANSFLLSERELGEFRLTFDVKLANNEDNSGLLFWSRPIGSGQVAGYQADIGAGWWGKLYEEYGRETLSEGSVEYAVSPGNWNQYVVEARRGRLRTWINGELAVDLEDSRGAYSGRFAFQLQSSGPSEVIFANFVLAPLE